MWQYPTMVSTVSKTTIKFNTVHNWFSQRIIRMIFLNIFIRIVTSLSEFSKIRHVFLEFRKRIQLWTGNISSNRQHVTSIMLWFWFCSVSTHFYGWKKNKSIKYLVLIIHWDDIFMILRGMLWTYMYKWYFSNNLVF